MKAETETAVTVKAKSKAKKLTDAMVRAYNRLDKDQIIPGDFPGLYLWVLKSGVKTWKYQQRIKGKKYPYRKTLGKYPTVGVNEALARAKQLSHKIYGGIDPREEIKTEALNIQLGVSIKKYYQEQHQEWKDTPHQRSPIAVGWLDGRQNQTKRFELERQIEVALESGNQQQNSMTEQDFRFEVDPHRTVRKSENLGGRVFISDEFELEFSGSSEPEL